MANRGRPTTPTKLKVLRGNPGKRPLNTQEPQPTPGIPECPDHLDEVARAEWDRITPELDVIGMLTKVDRAALAAYCSAWSRWVDAEKMLARYGYMLVSKETKNVYRSPYLDVSNRAMSQMGEFLREFGMTPSSRVRLVTNKTPQSDDPLVRILQLRAEREKQG